MNNLENDGIDKVREQSSKTVWKFPEQNELPENTRKVYCIDSKHNHLIGFHKEYDKANIFIDTSNRYFYCIAWTECLSFL